MTDRHDSTPTVPPFAAAGDLVAAALVIVGTVATVTGGTDFRIGGAHVSIHSASRPYLWAVLVLAVRNWLVPRPSTLDWLLRWRTVRSIFQLASGPLAVDEAALFLRSASKGTRARQVMLLFVYFSVLVVALTWPQIRHMYSVPDIADPLFSIWRLAWVNHQIVHDPVHLFDANIFYPERLTLTYSDPLLVSAAMAAPFFWLRIHPVLVYNLVLLLAFVFSGMAMFALVQALTGLTEAGLVAGTLFTLYPYRFEHYPHLELQMTMWAPLALWAVHRTIARGRLIDGLASGAAFALQALSSLYYALFLALYLVPFSFSLWLGHGRPRRALVMLAAGGVLAIVLFAPVAGAYLANRQMVGDRGSGAIQFYSAVGSDFLKPHFRSFWYGRWAAGGHPERQLFPRVLPVVLTAIALWPPLSVARIAYLLALVVSIDGALGLNGSIYPVLYAFVSPYKGLRVPARLGIFIGMTLAVLAGYGVARLVARWPKRRLAIAGVLVAIAAIEAMPIMPLEPVWRQPPPIYAAVAADPSAVLAEFPMPTGPELYFWDTRYEYFSLVHWARLVNGNSGHFPPSYDDLVQHERTFPDDSSIEYLRQRGVTYVSVHGRFYAQPTFQKIVQILDRRGDMQLVTAAPWEQSESRLYRLK